MKSSFKKLGASFMALFLMLMCFPFKVMAEPDSVTVNGLNYSLNESGKTASVVGYDSIPESGAVSIPSSITHNDITYAVTSIGREAFFECSKLTSIGIPNSITEIGTYAFSGCKNLATVNIPQDSQLTTIEIGAFFGCSGLKSIEIPSSVTIISQEAFENCSSLTTVTIHGGSKTIHISMYAFSSCSKLTSISLPKLVSFSDSVFSGCSKLEKIIIPCDFDKTRFIEVISSGIIPSDTDDTFSVLSTDTTGTFEYIHDYGETVYTWSELADGSLGCTATRICKNGASHTETAEGQVNQQYIGEPPTCTTGGKENCTATFSEDVAEWTGTQTTARMISALGHDWGEWFVDKEPTANEKGISKKICNRCGEEETKDILKLNDDERTEAPIKEGEITWLKEDSYGTSAWYGLDNRENVFPEGSTFWVRWINKENDPEDWAKYYGMLDENHKQAVEKDRLWIFLCGVRGPDDKEIHDFGDKTVDLYIQLGSDWDKNDIQAVFIDGSDDEDVKVEFLDNFEGPEGTGEYAKLTLKHFSPYAVYDAETNVFSDELSEENSNNDNSIVQNIQNNSDKSDFPITGDEIYLAVGMLVFISLICGSLIFILRKRKTA